jgi:hypothetical protein
MCSVCARLKIVFEQALGNRARAEPGGPKGLLLPGAFFVAIGAKLFAALMFVDLRFASFLQ